LETTNIVRKYFSWLDVLWSMASARYIGVAVIMFWVPQQVHTTVTVVIILSIT